MPFNVRKAAIAASLPSKSGETEPVPVAAALGKRRREKKKKRKED
jgi:hypothetical protein